MTNYIKKNQQLPEEIKAEFETIKSDSRRRDNLIKLLAEAGWTYESISNASSLTRERIRQIAGMGSLHPLDPSIAPPIPAPPLKPEKARPVYVEPHPDTLRRLLELQPYAQQVRSNGKKYRAEAEEYTALLNHAYKTEGVTLYRLAKRLGITHGAIRFRLARYGYIQPVSGTSKVYQPILRDNRILGDA